jgi:hypothetical protein
MPHKKSSKSKRAQPSTVAAPAKAPLTPELLVKTVKVSIVKPLDGSWEDVGRRLFDIRGSVHRLIAGGVQACLRLGREEQSSAQVAQAARNGVKEALAYEREWWRSCVGKKYEGSNHDPSRAERLAEFALPSVIEDAIATRVAKTYVDARKHMWRGDKRPPFSKSGAPIPFRDGSSSWKLERDAKGHVLSLKLFPGRGPMTRFAVRVEGASAHADLRRILDGSRGLSGIKLCDARVVRNDRTSQWEARLCYQFPRPAITEGTEVIAVHRGMHNFLTIAKTTGEVWMLPGDGYLQQKRAFSARRAQMAAHIRKGELGHGARGHGVRRRYKVLTRLDDAEARMIKSACQKAAKYSEHPSDARGQRSGVGVVDCALRGAPANVVLIEDYSTLPKDDARYMPSWPWSKLKDAVAWACKNAGLELREVPAAYISQRCPACHWTDASNVRTVSVRGDGTTTMFECTAEGCGFRRHVDAVAAFNMLAAGGLGDDPSKRFTERLHALARAWRRGQEAAAE